MMHILLSIVSFKHYNSVQDGGYRHIGQVHSKTGLPTVTESNLPSHHGYHFEAKGRHPVRFVVEGINEVLTTEDQN